MVDVTSPEDAVDVINGNNADLINLGNNFCASMKNRGGGVVDVKARVVRPRPGSRRRLKNAHGYVVVHVHVMCVRVCVCRVRVVFCIK